ncbi:MAG: Mobile element protein [Microvirga sp.]|nr:Mobile element protein [Microvirga sp.]
MLRLQHEAFGEDSVRSRAAAWFAAHGVPVERVLTDNGACYRSRDFAAALAATGTTHKRTRPYRPHLIG